MATLIPCPISQEVELKQSTKVKAKKKKQRKLTLQTCTCPQVCLVLVFCFEMNQKKKLCCVPICKGERFNLAHKFPTDAVRAHKWLEAIGCPRLHQIDLQKLSKMYQVCSRHFRIEDYKHPLSRGLNMTVVPSLNLKDLSQLHLSRDSTPRSCKAPNTIIVEELIQKELCTMAGEKAQFLELVDTERAEDYECMEIITIEDLKEEKAEDCTGQMNLEPYSGLEEDAETVRLSAFFEVSHSSYDDKLSINSFWLRCHCRCSICYDPITRRRKISPMDISERIQPKSVKQVDGLDVLSMEWNDGHMSEYDIDFLFNSQIIEEPRSFHQVPWHRDSNDAQEFTPIEFNHLVSCDEKLKSAFQNLTKLGVTVVEKIPTQSKTMAKFVLCRLFPQLETVHFEELNEVHSSICTNMTYFSAECGLKCFFVTRQAEIVIVDGIHVAQELKALNAAAFKTLSRVLVPLEINDKSVSWKMTAPIIEVDPETDEVLHLRLDVHRIGVLNTLPQTEVEEFYDALRKMIGITEAVEKQRVLKLNPGTMVILDDWRVFHKCCGKFEISECCVDRKNFVSRMRNLGLL